MLLLGTISMTDIEVVDVAHGMQADPSLRLLYSLRSEYNLQ